MTLEDFPRFNLKSKEGLADRKVPAQPLVYYNKDGKVSRYNLRKVSYAYYYFYNDNFAYLFIHYYYCFLGRGYDYPYCIYLLRWFLYMFIQRFY